MKNNNISFRISEELKIKLQAEAKKRDMNISEFVNRAIEQAINVDYLVESQEQFFQLFDYAFKHTYEPFNKKQLLILNKISFNTDWLIRILNLFIKNVSVPLDKDKINTSYIDHPILDMANEEVLKQIRQMRQRKYENEESE